MASFFRGGSIRDNLAHLLAMSYGMSGAVEVADDLLAQTGISDEITRLRAENERLRDLLRACLRGMERYDMMLRDFFATPRLVQLPEEPDGYASSVMRGQRFPGGVSYVLLDEPFSPTDIPVYIIPGDPQEVDDG